MNKHRGAISELRACSYLLEQGYEVFRNVSPCGAIDLVGMKDGEVHYFDVKTVSVKKDGVPSRPALTAEQHKLGVKILAVLPDGSIRENVRSSSDLESLSCRNCGGIFHPRKSFQVFCSKDCARGAWRDVTRLSRKSNGSREGLEQSALQDLEMGK